jgi:nitrate/nitrite transport system permease protein
VLGLSWLTPILRIAAGDNAKTNARDLWCLLGVPLLAIFALCAQLASTVQVWEQVGVLHGDCLRKAEREDAFMARQGARNAKLIAQGKRDSVKYRASTSAPIYCSLLWTSIQTVFFGFLLATIIAVPIGIACGLSPTANAAFNPIIQIFKPVSPLAWRWPDP